MCCTQYVSKFTFKKRFLLRSDFFGKRVSKGRAILEVGVLTKSYLLKSEIVSRLGVGNKGCHWSVAHCLP